MVKNKTGLPLTNQQMVSTGKPFPSFEYELKPGQKLSADRYALLMITRSAVKDSAALKSVGRCEHHLQTYRLVCEDLLPYLESGRLEFGTLDMTDDQYRLTVKFLLRPEDGETLVEIVTNLRSALEAAVYNGVHGNYELLAVCLGPGFRSRSPCHTERTDLHLGSP